MKTRNILLTTGTALCAAAATADGTHAGGHGHHDSAIGQPGQAAQVTRTIQVEMADTMRFAPQNIPVNQGETIRFAVRNSGQVRHEFVLGTEKELKEHYQQMMNSAEMEHADPQMVTVAPGQIGEVIWQFTKSGPVDFACLYPGHYDAGMKGLIKVSEGKANRKEDGHGHAH